MQSEGKLIRAKGHFITTPSQVSSGELSDQLTMNGIPADAMSYQQPVTFLADDSNMATAPAARPYDLTKSFERDGGISLTVIRQMRRPALRAFCELHGLETKKGVNLSSNRHYYEFYYY
jgi:hypothetical protein